MTTTSDQAHNYTTTGTSSATPTSLPFHQTSNNYATAAAAQKVISQSSQTANIPHDGRKKSDAGDEATSPVLENWKPNLDRKQSWNQEDFKREDVRKMLERRTSLGLDKDGVEKGFTEVRE